jgi:hypothetical protein
VIESRSFQSSGRDACHSVELVGEGQFRFRECQETRFGCRSRTSQQPRASFMTENQRTFMTISDTLAPAPQVSDNFWRRPSGSHIPCGGPCVVSHPVGRPFVQGASAGATGSHDASPGERDL